MDVSRAGSHNGRARKPTTYGFRSKPPNINQDESGDALAAELRETVVKLREAAGALEDMQERPPGDEPAYIALTTLTWTLADYLLEGSRARRFAYLDVLGRELAGLESAAEPLGSAVRAFRTALPGRLGRAYTRTRAVIERLVVEKVRSGSLRPAAAEDRELREVGLDAVISTEPLYVLQAYAAQVFRLPNAETAERRFVPIRRCIGALRNEMWAVATALERLSSPL
jgi:hypothetical protein